MNPDMYPHCHPAMIDLGGHALIVALFIGGLVGSISHCSSMCGPFVLAQVANFEIPEGKTHANWYRSLLLPYHFGRLTTYVLIGILATIVTKSITNSYVFNIISHLLLVGAGILFLLAAFSQLFKKISINFCSMPKWVVNWSTKLLPGNRLFASYLLGVMLGFLPCHLVYAAIAAVASTGRTIDATIGMIAFAIGTMPTLIFIGLGGRVLLQRQYFWLKPTSIILMLINGIMLFVMAGKGFV